MLPIALPAVALTAVGGVFAAFASVCRWALAVAVVAVVAGWLWVGWQSQRARRRAAPSTLRAMTLGTLIFGVALSWPVLESHIVALLRRTGATHSAPTAAARIIQPALTPT